MIVKVRVIGIDNPLFSEYIAAKALMPFILYITIKMYTQYKEELN